MGQESKYDMNNHHKKSEERRRGISLSGICRNVVKSGLRVLILQWLIFELTVYWYIRVLAISLNVSYKVVLIVLNPWQTFLISATLLGEVSKIPPKSEQNTLKQQAGGPRHERYETTGRGKRTQEIKERYEQHKETKPQPTNETGHTLVHRFPFYYVQMMRRFSLIEYFQSEITSTVRDAFDDFVALPDKAETIFNRYLKEPNAPAANVKYVARNPEQQKIITEIHEDDITDRIRSRGMDSVNDKEVLEGLKAIATPEVILTPHTPVKVESHKKLILTEKRKGAEREKEGSPKGILKHPKDSELALSESLSAKLSEVITDTSSVANKNFEPKKFGSGKYETVESSRFRINNNRAEKSFVRSKSKTFDPSDFYGSTDQPLQIINPSSPRGIKLINVELPNKQKSSFKLKITPKPLI